MIFSSPDNPLNPPTKFSATIMSLHPKIYLQHTVLDNNPPKFKRVEKGIDTHIEIILTETNIRVGCSDITPEAACKIVDEWRKHFGDKKTEIIL